MVLHRLFYSFYMLYHLNHYYLIILYFHYSRDHMLVRHCERKRGNPVIFLFYFFRDHLFIFHKIIFAPPAQGKDIACPISLITRAPACCWTANSRTYVRHTSTAIFMRLPSAFQSRRFRPTTRYRYLCT